MAGQGQEGGWMWHTVDRVRQEYYEMRAAAFCQLVAANGGIVPPCPLPGLWNPDGYGEFQLPDVKWGENFLENHRFLLQTYANSFTGVVKIEPESSPDSSPVQSPRLVQNDDDGDSNASLPCNSHCSGSTSRDEEVVSQPIVAQTPGAVAGQNRMVPVRLPRRKEAASQRVSLPRKAKDKATRVSCFCCRDEEQRERCQKKKKSMKAKNSKSEPKKKRKSKKSLGRNDPVSSRGQGEYLRTEQGPKLKLDCRRRGRLL